MRGRGACHSAARKRPSSNDEEWGQATFRGHSEVSMRRGLISSEKLPVPFLVALALVLSLGPAPAALALTEEETKRAEALIPLLDGEQEFWAIGEFVHIGPQALPVLAKALQHPSRRIRINAIETMFMIKDKAAVPILNSVAANEEEIPAVREKALREFPVHWRSEEHTSELQSQSNLVCRLLLEKKKKKKK